MTTLFQGDHETIAFEITDASGDPIDLSGVGITWALATTSRADDPTLEATRDAGITVIDAAAGRFDVELDSSETATLVPRSWYHEVELVDGNGDVTTVFTDQLSVRATVIDA